MCAYMRKFKFQPDRIGSKKRLIEMENIPMNPTTKKLDTDFDDFSVNCLYSTVNSQ